VLIAAATPPAEDAAGAAGEPSAGSPPPEPSAHREEWGSFLALSLAYMAGGHDLRIFAVENHLIPLIFR